MICSGAQPKSVLSQIGRKIAEVKRGSGAFVFFFSVLPVVFHWQ